MRTVIVIDFDPRHGRTMIEALSSHRSMAQGPASIPGQELDALAWYVEAVHATEARWAGIPD